MENHAYTHTKNAIHYFETMTPKVQEICKGLSYLGITHFWYDKFLPEGQYLSLGNDLTWEKHFYSHDFFNLPNSLIKIVKNTPLNQEHSLIWNDYHIQCCALISEQHHFNIGNHMSIVSKKENYAEAFSFASTVENVQINGFYIKHIDLIKNFCTFFKEKSTNLVKNCDTQAMAIMKETIFLDNELEEQAWEKKIKSFLRHTALSSVLRQPHYSKRELECLKYLATGKTAKEIARLMSIHYRTVESYIANMKSKSGCRRQTDLVRLFVEHEKIFL